MLTIYYIAFVRIAVGGGLQKCGRKPKRHLDTKVFAMILYFLASSNTKEDSYTHAQTTTHLYLHTHTRASIILTTY